MSLVLDLVPSWYKKCLALEEDSVGTTNWCSWLIAWGNIYITSYWIQKAWGNKKDIEKMVRKPVITTQKLVYSWHLSNSAGCSHSASSGMWMLKTNWKKIAKYSQQLKIIECKYCLNGSLKMRLLRFQVFSQIFAHLYPVWSLRSISTYQRPVCAL